MIVIKGKNTGLYEEVYYMKLYYSEDHRDELLELHDKHVMRDLEKTDMEFNDDLWNSLIDFAIEEFETKYQPKIFLCGRSNRHVCIEDNKANRLNYRHYKKFAEQLAKTVVDSYNTECKMEVIICE